MLIHRVLCFGGRYYADAARVDWALSQLPGILGVARFAIVHGDARGADRLCGEWGKRHQLPVGAVPANWELDGHKAAGPIRNQDMLEFFLPTYAVGFPGQGGTADMARRLKSAGVPTWLIDHMGN